MENKDKIKWHPGFDSALKLEFYDKKSRNYAKKDALMSIDSAMSVISQANTINLEKAKKEDSKMCKELMDLMKPEFDAALEVAVNEAINENTTSTTVSLIRNLMKNRDIDAEQAMTDLGISEDDFSKYLALL